MSPLHLSCVALSAQPCAAAYYGPAVIGAEARIATFAGLNLRMPLGATARPKPTAGLQLTSAFNVRDANKGTMLTLKGHGLEAGVAKGGKPSLYLNGRNATDIEEKLRMSGATKTILVAGGVLVRWSLSWRPHQTVDWAIRARNLKVRVTTALTHDMAD